MKDISAAICWIIAQVNDVRGMWLFGSQIAGRPRTDSDYDVIIESDAPKFTISERIALKRESKEKFGIQIDAVIVKNCAEFVRFMQIPKIQTLYISPKVDAQKWADSPKSSVVEGA